jgi:hypothetical protein
LYNIRVWDRIRCVYDVDVGCLKFRLELSLVNLFVSRILVVWWWRWWVVGSANDDNPVVVEWLNEGDAEVGTDVDDVAGWFGRCGARVFTWWLLSDSRSNLLTASGDWVPENVQKKLLVFYRK